MPAVTTTCDIKALAAQGAAFSSADKAEFQALKDYILSRLLYVASSNTVNIDVCALATSLAKYDSLSDYALRNAELQVINNLLAEFGVKLDENAAKAAIACAHCCNVTLRSLKAAEICLWYLLFQEQMQED